MGEQKINPQNCKIIVVTSQPSCKLLNLFKQNLEKFSIVFFGLIKNFRISELRKFQNFLDLEKISELFRLRKKIQNYLDLGKFHTLQNLEKFHDKSTLRRISVQQV